MGWGNKSLLVGSGSHDQDGHHVVKNPSKFIFSRTKGPMTLWLGMWHWGLGPIIVYSNDDPRLTLTILSNLVSYAFIWGKLLESHLMEETYSK